MGTVYYNAAVYTGDSAPAQAFIVREGQFVFAGSDAEALSRLQPGDTAVDLGGNFVCPGFNDSHMHVLNFGQALGMAPLHEHTDSLEALLECLKEFLKQGRLRGGWLMGRGWNQDYFTDANRMPNRYDLDRVSTQVPICIPRACGHAIAVNSRALEMLGITAQTPAIDGGEIVMENGEPNGIFFDNAMDLIYDAIPAPTEEELSDMLRLACRALNRYGVTSCHSDDFCVFAGVTWEQVDRAFRKLEDAGELTVRVYEQCNFTDVITLESFLDNGNCTGTGSDRYRIGPLKLLGDGALGARTAFLSRPYADAPDTRGLSVFTQAEFDALIGCAHRRGMQVAVHAIGDACLDRVLSSLQKAMAAAPREDHRHGIVHCQITRRDQLETMANMGLHIYAQTIFLDYDNHIVLQRVGPELAESSYRWKTLKAAGCTVSNGTDCPVEQPIALAGIQCAVTRTSLDGSCGPYHPEEAFPLSEALDSYTSGSAYASFEEDRKGKIQAGMLADFVILGENPFTVAPHAIRNIPVLATYLGGEAVYRA